MNKSSSALQLREPLDMAMRSGEPWAPASWTPAGNKRWLTVAGSQPCTAFLVISRRPKRAWRFSWK
jgi:hypothetical protein